MGRSASGKEGMEAGGAARGSRSGRGEARLAKLLVAQVRLQLGHDGSGRQLASGVGPHELAVVEDLRHISEDLRRVRAVVRRGSHRAR